MEAFAGAGEQPDMLITHTSLGAGLISQPGAVPAQPSHTHVPNQPAPGPVCLVHDTAGATARLPLFIANVPLFFGPGGPQGGWKI